MSNVVPIRPLADSYERPPDRTVTGGAAIAGSVLVALWSAGDDVTVICAEEDDLASEAARTRITAVVEELRACLAECIERAATVDSVCVDAAVEHLASSADRLEFFEPHGGEDFDTLPEIARCLVNANQLEQIRAWCEDYEEDIQLVMEFFDWFTCRYI